MQQTGVEAQIVRKCGGGAMQEVLNEVLIAGGADGHPSNGKYSRSDAVGGYGGATAAQRLDGSNAAAAHGLVQLSCDTVGRRRGHRYKCRPTPLFSVGPAADQRSK